MTTRNLTTTTLALLVSLATACDKGETKDEKPAEAPKAQASEPDKGEVLSQMQAGDADEERAAAQGTIEAEAFDLEATVELVAEGNLEGAEDLEAELNDRDDPIHQVDIDADGEIDSIQVVEVEPDASIAAAVVADAGGEAEASAKGEAEAEGEGEAEAEGDAAVSASAEIGLEIRAIPSSKKDAEDAVALARVDLVPLSAEGKVEVQARWSTAVRVAGSVDAKAEAKATLDTSAEIVAEPVVARRVEADFDDRAVVRANAFVVWAFEPERPAYYGVWVREHHGVKIPPGHAKHGLWKATGEHPGHGKDGDDEHGKPDDDDKGKGKGKGKADAADDDKGKGKGKADDKHHKDKGKAKADPAGDDKGKGKAKADDKGKAKPEDTGKSKAADSGKGKPKPENSGKGDKGKGQPAPAKGDKGKGKG